MDIADTTSFTVFYENLAKEHYTEAMNYTETVQVSGNIRAWEYIMEI